MSYTPTPTRQRCTISYQIATYSGTETVYCVSDDDPEDIIANFKHMLTKKFGGSLPFGYQSFSIISREDYTSQ